MKRFVLVLLVALMLVPCATALCDVPFCDVAMETMRLSDWVACAVFALLMGDADDIPGGVVVYL